MAIQVQAFFAMLARAPSSSKMIVLEAHAAAASGISSRLAAGILRR